MAIVQQLQAETGSILSSSTNQSITLGAGANRLFLVAVLVDTATNPPNPFPVIVRYGGVDMSLVTDGESDASSATFSGISSDSVFWYVLRETQLPANGANNLSVVFSINTLNTFVVGWWILENCSQSALVRSVANAGTTAAVTTLATTLAPGALSDAILVAAINNDSAGTIQITIGGVSLTEDFDVTMSSARAAAGTDLTAPSIGTVVCDMTYTLPSIPIASMSAIRIAEFFVPGGTVLFSDEAA